MQMEAAVPGRRIMNGREQEKAQQHIIRNTIGAALTDLNTARKDADAQALEYIHLMERILMHLDEVIESQPILILDQSTLNNLNNVINQSLNHIRSFTNSKNINHLLSAYNNISKLLTNRILYAFIVASKALKKLPNDIVKSFEHDIKHLVSKLNDLNEEIRLSESSLKELNSKQQNLSNTVTSQFSQWQQQFMEQMDALKKKFIEEKDALIFALKTDVENIEEWSEEKKANIEQIHHEIRELHGIVAADAIAGSHAKLASEERRNANIWRVAAVGAYLLAAAWSVFGYFEHIAAGQKIEVEAMQGIKWLAIVGIIFWIGAFCATQSKMHRINERRSKWFELEVRALAPFMQEIDDEKKKELRERLCEQYFGHWRELGNVSETPGQEHIWGRIIKEIREGVSEILESIKRKNI